MAHVLLPCDLPSWNEVQKLLAELRKGNKRVTHIIAMLHEACSVSLDPEDSGPVLGHPGFESLETFLRLEGEERFGALVSKLAEWASKLKSLKPRNGLHYSLRTQESTFCIERSFVSSLVAHAFFSTFPRRKVKTHPTLLDFGMADFFTRLDRESHQKKLRSFLRYYESLEPEPDGIILFIRKVFHGPSLPGWLCSERPLVPLVVRPQGSIDEAEPWVFRGCFCESAVGGNVLTESTSQESSLFFECPELLACLCFLESLVEEESLIVEGIRTPNTQDVNLCFVDMGDCGQLDDRGLLGCLNKAAGAFSHEPRRVDRRRTPDGGESSEELSRRSAESREGRIPAEKMRRIQNCMMLSAKKPMLTDKSLSQASSRFSMRTASESSGRLDDEYYTADEESDSASESASNRLTVDLPPSSSSSRRSPGFVLGGGHTDEDDSEEDSLLCNKHERLEDFRRRIRRRTRRRNKESRRRSCSYSSGSASDMEDIVEDPGEDKSSRPLVTIRPACSEPSLVTMADPASELPPIVSPEALLSPYGQRQLLAATCAGPLKAYSHDGVRPNLPVPFRARFRDKRRNSGSQSQSEPEDISEGKSRSATEDKDWMSSRCPVAVSATRGENNSNEDPQLRALVLWLAASMVQLPALILYTMDEPALKDVIPIYKQVLNRKWKVGDLACEVLRFCRNQTVPGHRTGKYPHLFAQLMADQTFEDRPGRKIFTEESLD